MPDQAFHKKQQLREIETEMETYGSTSALDKRWRRLHQQVYSPTIRQKLFGFRSGRLTKEERDEIRMRKAISNIFNLLEKEDIDGQEG